MTAAEDPHGASPDDAPGDDRIETADGSRAARAPRTPPKIPRPEPAPRVDSPAIERLAARLEAAATAVARDAVLEAFWSAHPRTPLVEPVSDRERIVTFVRRDAEAEQVLLFVNRLTDERDLDRSLMERLPGTDLWHLAYRMRDDWRASYAFLRRLPGEDWPWGSDPDDQIGIRHALDRGLADPRNPETCRNRPGTAMSVVALDAAPPQPWLLRRPDHDVRGSLTRLLGPGRRPVWVYDPTVRYEPVPDVRGDAVHPILSVRRRPLPQPLPVVVLLDGEVWTGTQDIAATLDNLIAEGLIRPCLVAMPETGGRDQRWAELDDDGTGSDWIVRELLPWLRSLAPVSRHPDDVIIAGQSLGAYTALRCALEHPEAVGGVLSQSASLWQRELYAAAPGLVYRLHAYIEVGEQEWVLREPNTQLAGALINAGADVHFVEYNGGHDYACWRGGIADGLCALLGPAHHTDRLARRDRTDGGCHD